MDFSFPKIVNNVKYKKMDGIFSLLTDRITWVPESAQGKKFHCLYSDIKVQRISPDTSSKVQLQIVQHDDTSHNFHFGNPKGRDVQLQERNQMKDLLAELIPEHRHKANKDLEEKNKIFKEKPELYQLYKELVVSSIITADEFWENQKSNIHTSKFNQKQEVGIASGFLAELKPDMHGCNELRFNLTADSIEAIFKMYPAVKKKYISVVPSEMTEKQFWTEFFKSQHFHRDRVPKTSSKDMFGDLAKKDEQEQFQKIVEGFFDPLIDFSTTSPNTEEGYGMASRGKATNEPLIKQFNHQSLMVLQNSLKRLPARSTESQLEFKKKRIRDAIEFEELEKRNEDSPIPLEILDTDKFALKSETELTNGHTNGLNNDDNTKNMLQFKNEIKKWSLNLSNALSAEVASEVIIDVAPGGRLMKKTNNANLSEIIPKDLTQEMKKNYLSTAELLRHFWTCFPITTPQLDDKVRRMASSLEKYRDSKLQNFKCMLPAHFNYLGDHMSEMIDTALQKFKSWAERRTKPKM